MPHQKLQSFLPESTFILNMTSVKEGLEHETQILPAAVWDSLKKNASDQSMKNPLELSAKIKLIWDHKLQPASTTQTWTQHQELDVAAVSMI